MHWGIEDHFENHSTKHSNGRSVHSVCILFDSVARVDTVTTTHTANMFLLKHYILSAFLKIIILYFCCIHSRSCDVLHS